VPVRPIAAADVRRDEKSARTFVMRLMSNRRSRAAHWLLVVSAAFVATGCLPIPMTYRESPAIVGTLRGTSDVSPVGVRLVLSTTYRDSTCTQAASEAVTDARGTFQFAGIQHRSWFFPLLPFERFGTYRLCAATDSARFLLHSENYLHRPPRHAALDCAAWHAHGTIEGTCSRSDWPSILTGGDWSTEDSAGAYRLLVFRPGHASIPHRVLVQWIGRRRAGLTDTIFAMREYRFAFDEIRWPEPSLLRCDGVWYASIDKRAKRPDRGFRGWPLGMPGQIGPEDEISVTRCESPEK
jgi:hypothetical protein